MTIPQVYIPYWKWEDWINGMWRTLKPDEVEAMLKKCIEFTGNHVLYGEAMKRVVIQWPDTMLNSLTNSSINQRAFVGHCACQLEFNCPEYITRMAWKELTDNQRILADREADKAISFWKTNYFNNEKKNRILRRNMGAAMLP